MYIIILGIILHTRFIPVRYPVLLLGGRGGYISIERYKIYTMSYLVK